MARPLPELADVALTVPEVAKSLKVSEDTVRALINSGDLPAMRIASRVIVGRAALAEWAAANSRATFLPGGVRPAQR